MGCGHRRGRIIVTAKPAGSLLCPHARTLPDMRTAGAARVARRRVASRSRPFPDTTTVAAIYDTRQSGRTVYSDYSGCCWCRFGRSPGCGQTGKRCSVVGVERKDWPCTAAGRGRALACAEDHGTFRKEGCAHADSSLARLRYADRVQRQTPHTMTGLSIEGNRTGSVRQRLETFFEFSRLQTTWKTEILAGFTTFITMAYIVLVNPAILQEAGM